MYVCDAPSALLLHSFLFLLRCLALFILHMFVPQMFIAYIFLLTEIIRHYLLKTVCSVCTVFLLQSALICIYSSVISPSCVSDTL